MSERKECKFCDKVWAAFGVALGVVFLYVSVDLMTGGRLTGMLSRRAEVTSHDDAE